MKVWIKDLTYLRTDSDWHYLIVILYLFNREIIGYSLSSRLTTESTVVTASDRAFLQRQSPRVAKETAMKTEWIYGKRYRNQQELRQSLFDYIEVSYNRKRLHSSVL